MMAQVSVFADSPTTNHSVEFDIRPSWVIPTNSYLKGDNGECDIKSAVAPHLRYSFKFAPHTRYGQLYSHAYQGVGLSYLATLPGASLGHPVNIYVSRLEACRIVAAIITGLRVEFRCFGRVEKIRFGYESE